MLEENQDPLAHTKVWLLSDGRAGHENQSRGIISALGIKDVTTHTLKFKKYGRIFSIFGPKHTFENLPPEPYPDVIIGTGKHIAAVSAYIKRRSPTTFAIHLMNVPSTPNLFDVLAAPMHDNPPNYIPQLMATLGAANNIQTNYIKTEAERWASRLHHLPQPYTAVLVGGSSKHWNFTPKYTHKFTADLIAFAQKYNTSLLISTSRRTGQAATQYMQQELEKAKIPHFFHDARNPTTRDNPYHALLGSANTIIATADSVSMLSEAASTGKHTLIWGQDYIKSAKFQRFYTTLIQQHSIQPMHSFNPDQKPNTLNEASRIAGFIRSQYMRWMQGRTQTAEV